MASSVNATVKRATLIFMAVDANCLLFLIVGYGLLKSSNPLILLEQAPGLMLMIFLLPAALWLFRLSSVDRRWVLPVFWLRAMLSVAAVVFLFSLYYRFTGKIDGLTWLFIIVAVGMTAEVVAVRGLTVARHIRAGRTRKAVVVGGGWSGCRIIDTVLCEPKLRIRFVGIIDDDSRKKNFSYKGVQVVGDGRRLREIVREQEVDLVITAISYLQDAELVEKLLQLKMQGVEIVDMPRFYERSTGQVPIKHVKNSWFLYSGGFDILHRPALQHVKRIIDVAIAVAGILLSLPLTLLVALLIKIDSRGPVFFRQERVGLNEKAFQLYKFRSMRTDAEEETGPVWTRPGDYRITRVGQWLRKTRLDEVPQFINVLRGDMSFIGPRPERPFFVEQLKREIPYYSFRFSVRPGLTGWAQVRYQYGSTQDDAIEKLKYELYYIKNMSLRLDLLIAFKTLKVVLAGGGM